MNFPHPTIERPDATLESAVSDLITACGGSVAAAKLCRVEKSQLDRYSSLAYEIQMPIDVVLSLELHCKVPHVTRFMAMQTQNVLVSTGEGYSDAIAVHMGKIGQDTGSLYKQFADAIADGTLSRKEIARLLAAAFKDLNSIAALIGDLWRTQRGETA